MMAKRNGGDEFGNGYAKKPKGMSGKIGLRILIQSKMAGCLIGKGGSNITRLRSEYNCHIRIPDCSGPERIMEITAEDWESVYNALEASVPWLYECPDGVDDGKDKELRFLVHQSTIGGIIGKGGEKIKAIREASGCNIKVYQSPAPQSTERCVQANGGLDKLISAAREIIDVVLNSDIKGNELMYDPLNFDAFFAGEYGGYGSGSDARPRRQPAQPMGGRGMSPMGMRGGGGGMRGGMGPARGGFGGFDEFGGGNFGRPRGGYGNFNGGDGEWGGGFASDMPFGGGMGNGKIDAGSHKLNIKQISANLTEVQIENETAGALIGPGGQRIRKIRMDSKAQINIGEPNGETKKRIIKIEGDPECIQFAIQMLQQCLAAQTSSNFGRSGGFY